MSHGANLLPASWVTRRERDRRVLWWLRTLVPSAVVTIGIIAWCLVMAANHGASGGRLIQDAQTRHDEQREALDQLRRDYNDAMIQRAEAARVDRQPDWSLFLAIVADVAGPEATLHRLHLAAAGSDIDRFDLRIAGRAPSLMDATRIAQRLEALVIFERVTLGETTRRADGTAEFSISASLRAPSSTIATGETRP